MIVMGHLSATTQPALSSSTPSLLCRVPPGPSQVLVTNTSGQTAWIGTSSSVSAGNGFALPNGNGPIPIETWRASPAQQLYVIVSGGAPTGSVSFVVSSDH